MTPQPDPLSRDVDARIAHRRAVRLAAERVARLSRPGTPERLFTLIDVAEQSGVSASEIVTELIGRKTPQ